MNWGLTAATSGGVPAESRARDFSMTLPLPPAGGGGAAVGWGGYVGRGGGGGKGEVLVGGRLFKKKKKQFSANKYRYNDRLLFRIGCTNAKLADQSPICRVSLS